MTCQHDGNPLAMLPSDPYIKRRLADKYFVEKLIGTGGMGTVYLAKHESMNRRVAIKMMRAQFVHDRVSVKRFELEAIALAKLEHAHIINTYDHGYTVHGQPYIVMEYLQGTSLAELVKDLKGLPVGRVIDIFDQVCDALDFSHKKGVLHRDLKPGNIMLLTDKDPPGCVYVKVVDFGVAKLMDVSGEEAQSLTQQGEVCGSPVYMSPEQCLGQDLDRRADIYSMGIVLFESLTGKLPLIGKNMMETMGKHIHGTPPTFQQVRPDLYIPERLERVVMKALSKKPEERQQTMEQLRAELLDADPRPKKGDAATPNLQLRAKISSSVALPQEETPASSPLIPVLVAVVALVVIVGGGFFVVTSMQKPPAQTTAPVAPASVSKPVIPDTAPTSATLHPNGVPPSNPTPASSMPSPGPPVVKTTVVPPVTTVHPATRPVRAKKVSHPAVASVKVNRTPVSAPPTADVFKSLGDRRSWKKPKM